MAFASRPTGSIAARGDPGAGWTRRRPSLAQRRTGSVDARRDRAVGAELGQTPGPRRRLAAPPRIVLLSGRRALRWLRRLPCRHWRRARGAGPADERETLACRHGPARTPAKPLAIGGLPPRPCAAFSVSSVFSLTRRGPRPETPACCRRGGGAERYQPERARSGPPGAPRAAPSRWKCAAWIKRLQQSKPSSSSPSNRRPSDPGDHSGVRLQSTSGESTPGEPSPPQDPAPTSSVAGTSPWTSEAFAGAAAVPRALSAASVLAAHAAASNASTSATTCDPRQPSSRSSRSN